jgi:glycosyltransferase involved in cell wall biosynthesis
MNNKKVFESNFLASPCLGELHPHQIVVQEGFSSASKAYNDAIDKSRNDLIVFVHQDMIFPKMWLSELENSLQYLEVDDPNWGVIGCYGETVEWVGRGYIYSSGLGVMGKSFERPTPVQTLDEIVLIVRKSSGLRFDDKLPNFHFYGADICMTAHQMGKTNYAISAFCIHNTKQFLVLPPEYYDCYRYFKTKWKSFLPIQTTCVRVTRFGVGMIKRRLLELYLGRVKRKSLIADRSEDPQQLLEMPQAR